MQCSPNKLIFRYWTNSFLYLVRNCWMIFFFLKQDLKIVGVFSLSLEDNKEYTWNKPTLNRSLSYAMLSEDTDFIKMNSFIHFAANFWKTFSFLKQDLKILSFFDLELKLKMLALFLSLKDNTEYMYILNQHWIGKHPMQCCPNRLIHINARS